MFFILGAVPAYFAGQAVKRRVQEKKVREGADSENGSASRSNRHRRANASPANEISWSESLEGTNLKWCS
ncbi:hypothetical protein OIDMADRAFT_16070, partial [Oidiodendron maius Zn]